MTADGPDGPARAPLRVGLLGAGMITTVSYGFLPGLARMRDRAEVVAIASRTRAAAEAVARDWDIPDVHDDLASLLERDDVDVVVNATSLPAHHETSQQILAAGKHLVTDKPIASTLDEADELIALAESHGTRIACAPAEMLYAEWAEARRLVRDGAIGKPAFSRVQSSHGGPASMSWPVDPAPNYRHGQGSLLDMGVYGIDRATAILGPAVRVSAFAGIAEPTRVVEGGPFDGEVIDTEAVDNVLVTLDHGDATYSVVDGCYTVVATRAAPMEVYGLEGSLVVERPDVHVPPDRLALELFSTRAAPLARGWSSMRRVGPDRARLLQRASLVDHLADCLETGAPLRVGPERARHVLEVMLAAETSAREGRAVGLTTTF